jgi:hypothetical protein
LLVNCPNDSYFKISNSLIHKYYSRSLVFQLFFQLLINSRMSNKEISNTLLVSESYSYALIKRLSDIFEELPLEIRYKQKEVELIAKEGMIRYLLVLIFSKVYWGREWPLSISKNKTNRDYNSNVVKAFSKSTRDIKEKVFYYETILTIRRKHRSLNHDFSDDEEDFIDLIILVNDLSKYSIKPDHIFISEKRIIEEKRMTNLLLRICFSESETDEVKLKIGEVVYFDSGYFSLLAKKISNSLIEKFGLSKEKNFQFYLIYHISLFLVVCSYFKYDLSMLSGRKYNIPVNNLKDVAPEYLALLCFVDNLISELPNLYFIQKSKLLFVDMLFFALRKNSKRKLKLFYQFFNQPIFTDSIIKNRFFQFISTNSVEFVDNIYEADIILSDSYIKDTYYGEKIYIYDIFNYDDWKEIISKIQKKIFLLNGY